MNFKARKTIVYIDGFNFYYGALNNDHKRGKKWLNIELWIQRVFPSNQYTVQKIKFFTASVSGTKSDPLKPTRQKAYFRALDTLNTVERIMGNFIKKKIKLAVSDDIAIHAKTYEEKGTDVNIAAHLVNDAHKKLFEVAILVCNDSDLADAVRIVTQELKLEVIVVNPSKNRYPAALLRKYASFTKNVREGKILSSQFPSNMKDSNGQFFKPPAW